MSSARSRRRRVTPRRPSQPSSHAISSGTAIAAAITLVAVISMRETKGSSLHELDRIDQERLADAPAESVRA